MFQTKTIYNEEKKIWSGTRKVPLFNRDVSIGQAILQIGRCHGDKIIQINDDDGVTFTAKKILNLTVKIANNLQILGLQQEDIVGIVAVNSNYLAPLLYGILCCGVTFHSIAPSLSTDNLKHVLGVTKPKIIFCDVSEYSKIEDIFQNANVVPPIYTIDEKLSRVKYIDEFLVDTEPEHQFSLPMLKKGGKQIAAILCSSGTTGPPKCVCLPHQALLKQAMGLPTTEDTILCFSAASWMSGLVMILDGILTGATRIITRNCFKENYFLELIEKYKVTITLTPPSHMALAVACPDIERRNLSSLKFYICGGSMLHYAIKERMQSHIKDAIILVGYGMTEVAGGITVQDPKIKNYHPESVGKLCPNVDLAIRNENNESLSMGEIGEIYVRTDQSCYYCNNPEANKKAFTPDGWYRTGDVGYVDEYGTLCLKARKSDAFKYKNILIFPTEIEMVISEIPDVSECCILGIFNTASKENLCTAAVVKKPESSLNQYAICNYVNERLPNYKQLHGGVYFLESLPKTVSGKIQRSKIKDLITKRFQIITTENIN